MMTRHGASPPIRYRPGAVTVLSAGAEGPAAGPAGIPAGGRCSRACRGGRGGSRAHTLTSSPARHPGRLESSEGAR
jgi:hypothetical protein